MNFEKKLGLSNVSHERMYNLIMDLILNNFSKTSLEASQKPLLKTFCYKNKCTRKVNGFQKLSNK